MDSIRCAHCGHLWEFEPPMGRRDECPACGQDSRVCLNCVHHDPGVYRGCREPQAEWVREKNEGNFCGYFRAGAGPGSALNNRDEQMRLHREGLAKLFGDSPSPLSDAIRSPEDLFKKSK